MLLTALRRSVRRWSEISDLTRRLAPYTPRLILNKNAKQSYEVNKPALVSSASDNAPLPELNATWRVYHPVRDAVHYHIAPHSVARTVSGDLRAICARSAGKRRLVLRAIPT